MIRFDSFKERFFVTACYLYVLLFTYAAVSKLSDFENFRVQLGQSPLISVYASWLSLAVPLTELLIALGLVFALTRGVSLFAGYMLMVIFTAYIYIMLHYSSFVPCSCGGLLEKMGWQTHLLFNIGFTLLGLIAILLQRPNGQPALHKKNTVRKVVLLFFTTILSITSVWIIFKSSESRLHTQNPFIRQFIPFSAHELHRVKLDYNSYYLAGADSSTIYLGNYTAPLHVAVFDTALSTPANKQIDHSRRTARYITKSLHLSVTPPHFFLTDGHGPVVLRGSSKEWCVTDAYSPDIFFSRVAIKDSLHLLVRTRQRKNGESILAQISLSDNKVKYYPQLLERQVDGVFDTDGDLLYDKYTHSLFYSYRYRNEFMSADTAANVLRLHTIDTNTRAKLRITTLQGRGERKFAAPPEIVNKSAAVYRNLAFIYSMQRGRFESRKLWKSASAIDVYDLASGSYLSSFYLYHIDGEPVRQLLVWEDRLYAIAGSTLVCYKLEKAITKYYIDKPDLTTALYQGKAENLE